MKPAAYDDLVPRLRAAGCVFAEDEARLLLDAARVDGSRDGRGAASSTDGRLEELVARRVAGEPLEHVLGWADFAGVRVLLDPGVFVPRQRTAFLVDLAETALVSRLAPLAPQPAAPERLAPLAPQPAAAAAVVVDLCCGSGALGLALAGRHPGIELHAADADPAAVACARRNLEPIGATVHLGDLDAPLPDRLRGRVDVLVANVPYVPAAAMALMPPESRDHEPRAAVDGGADGLDVVRRLADLAPRWLAPGGRVFVETGTDQAVDAVDAFARAGLRARIHLDDDRAATVIEGEYE